MTDPAQPAAGRSFAFGARTPEEAERRRFSAWALAALLILLPIWWLWGADIFTAALRWPAMVVMGATGLQGPDITSAHGWSFRTGIDLADGGELTVSISREMLRRLSLGVPLFAAFMTPPPRPSRPLRAAAIGLLVLTVMFLVSVAGYTWGEIAPVLNPALASEGAPQTLRAMAEPLNPLLAQTALLIRYFGMSAGPLAAAVLLWALLNPSGRLTLIGAIGDDVR